MRSHRGAFALVLLVALLLVPLAVACGNDDEPPEETTSSTEATTTTALEPEDEDESGEMPDDMGSEDMESAVECLDEAQQLVCDTFSVEPKSDLPVQVDLAITPPEGVAENWVVAQCATEARETVTEWQEACHVQTVSPLSVPAGSIIGLPVTRMMDTRAAGAVDCGTAPCEITVIDPAAGAIAACPITFAE